MIGQKVSPQDSHCVGYPRIAHGIIAPEVLVRIDVHLLWTRADARRASSSSAEPFHKPLSAEIEESSVNRIIGAGDKSGFVRAKEKSQCRNLFGFAHAADWL